jgi:hypothetical protein
MNDETRPAEEQNAGSPGSQDALRDAMAAAPGAASAVEDNGTEPIAVELENLDFFYGDFQAL